MKTNFNILGKQLVTVFLFILFASSVDAQIDLNKVKIKTNKNQTQEKEQDKGQTNKFDYKEMRAFYENRTAVVKSWPFTIHNSIKMEDYLSNIVLLDMPNFEKQIQQDKSKNPSLFMFFGMNQCPTGMQKGSGKEPWDHGSDEFWINDAIARYYQWKDKLTEQTRDLAQLANNYINAAESANETDKLEKADLALQVVRAIKSIQPENLQIDDLEKRALQVQERCFEAVKHLITGQVHKENIKKLVAFNEKPTIGSENKSAITNEIIIGKPFYVVGYFTNKLTELDIKGHIGGIPMTKAPVLEWHQIGSDNNYGRLQMYWNEDMMLTVREQTYFVFEMFPDIDKVDFKSHVEYIPIMNFVKWITYQMPGTYEFYCKFSNGAATNILAENTFKINLSKENIEHLKGYYEKLEQKRLKAVTFNAGSGCADVKATIGKKDDMKKYGELVKLTVKETGPVMQPWPKEHLVEYYVGYGYGIFKRTDGKHEIILLNFRRSPQEKTFSFFGANQMNHYEIEGSTPISFPILNLGYEISPDGINKCTRW